MVSSKLFSDAQPLARETNGSRRSLHDLLLSSDIAIGGQQPENQQDFFPEMEITSSSRTRRQHSEQGVAQKQLILIIDEVLSLLEEDDFTTSSYDGNTSLGENDTKSRS
jgi:hypothetical protein